MGGDERNLDGIGCWEEGGGGGRGGGRRVRECGGGEGEGGGGGVGRWFKGRAGEALWGI